MSTISKNEKETLEIKESFDFIDEDKDGLIQVEDIVRGIHILGLKPTSKEVDGIIAELNALEKKSMDFGTYEQFMKKKLKEVNYEHNLFKKSFKKFDKDGDGFVTFEELRSRLKGMGTRMSDKEVQSYFEEADIDKDGKIDYDEFVKWFSNM